MGTMMLMVTLFAVLFAVMQSFKLPGWLIFVIAGLFLTVGMAQVWLLRGRRPKLASMIAGAMYAALVVAAIDLIEMHDFQGQLSMWNWLRAILFAYMSIPVGVVLGYIFGCMAAGVFLFWRVEPDGAPDESADNRSEEETPEPPSWDERILSPLFKMGHSFYKTRATATPFRAWRNVTIALFLVGYLPAGLYALAEDAGRGSIYWGESACILIPPVVLGGLYVSLRLAGWKAVLAFPLLGSLGALPMALPVKRILWPWDDDFQVLLASNWPYLWATIAGLAMGILIAIVFGWVRYYRGRLRKVDGRQSNVKLALTFTIVLIACLVTGFFSLTAYSRSPQQRAIALLTDLECIFDFDKSSGLWRVEIIGPIDDNVDPGLVANLGPIGEWGLHRISNGDRWLDAVRSQTQLRRLVLSNTRLKPESFNFLSQHRNFRLLCATDCNVDDSHLEKLSGLRALRHLELRNVDISDEGLLHMRGLPSLETLILSQDNITDKGIEHLGECFSLATLDLQDTNVTGSGLHYLGGLQTLCYLRLSSAKLTSHLGRELGALKALEELDLSDSQLPQGGLEGIEGLSLKKIDLSGTELEENELSHLKCIGCLESLYLDNTGVGDEAMVHVVAVRSLVELRICRTRVSNHGIRRLEGHPTLTSLVIADTQVDDTAVESLKKIPRLEPASLLFSPLSHEAQTELYEFQLKQAQQLWGLGPEEPKPDADESNAEPE
ncbi:MAG: hypothetical protein JW818_01820 [Pirellulales bacterium]|nr:hypothetical protein [Pirellulales bacterium]